MAYYSAQATGNWDTAATWGTLLVGNDNAAPVAGTTLTTTFVAASTTNTPGAVTVDGILVKLANVSGSAGAVTISVALNTGGGSTTVANTTVTINVSDLPTCSSGPDEGGWIQFVFAAPVLLTAATAYSVTAKVSGAGPTVNLYATATTNWSYLIRQSGTTNTPGASDLVVISKEWTAAATGTARTVTMNHTSATAILKAAGSLGAINICQGGTLRYATTTATTLQLVVGDGATANSDVRVYSGGTLDMNTQSDITTICKLLLNVTAAQADALSGFVFKNGSTVTGTGFTRTRKTTLTSDAAANATTFPVADVTGWQNGDTLALAPTTRTATQGESVTIASISALTVTISVGGGSGANSLLNAHGGGGTALVVAEVINLTSNIVLGSNQSTLASTGSGYIDIKQGASVTLSQVEFRYLGGTTSGNGTSTTGNRGIEIEVTTGSCSLTNCAIHDCRNYGVVLNTGSGSVTCTGLAGYNLNTVGAASSNGFQMIATSGAHTISGTFIGIVTPNNGTAVGFSDVGSSVTNLSVSGSGVGTSSFAVQFNENNIAGTANGWNIHTNAGVGFSPSSSANIVATIGSAGSPCYSWRNGGDGIRFVNPPDKVILDSWTMFGNTTQNVNVATAGLVWLKTCTSRSDATFSTTSGLTLGGAAYVYITDSDFGGTTAHTQDINVSSLNGAEVDAWNTFFRSASGVPTISATALATTIIRMHKFGAGAVTAFKAYQRFGSVVADNTHVSAGQTTGILCTPNANASAGRPFYWPGPTLFGTMRLAVSANPATGVSLTIPVWLSGSGGTGVTARALGGIVAGVGSFGTDVTASTTVTGSFQNLTLSGLIPTEAGVLEFLLQADSSSTIFWIGAITVSES